MIDKELRKRWVWTRSRSWYSANQLIRKSQDQNSKLLIITMTKLGKPNKKKKSLLKQDQTSIQKNVREYVIFTKENNIVFIKRGFSFPAFFFTWIWGFYKKLWKLALVYFGCALLLFAVLIHFDIPQLFNLLLFLGKLFFGFFGNEWLVENLESQGFQRYAETISAKNKKEALKIVGGFIEKHGKW